MKPEDRDYWGSDPTYPIEDWKYEVQNGDTRMGYWRWVQSRKEAEGDES